MPCAFLCKATSISLRTANTSSRLLVRILQLQFKCTVSAHHATDQTIAYVSC